jgi:hypothetical protein
MPHRFIQLSTSEIAMGNSRRAAAVVLLVVLVLAACAPSANPLIDQAVGDGSSAGFLLGIWHGFIVVITFFISLFSDSVGVYEVHNTGWSYNLGYLIGLMMALGGSGAGAGRRK